MMFLFRKYKKLMIFLIYVHSFKTTYIKKRKEYISFIFNFDQWRYFEVYFSYDFISLSLGLDQNLRWTENV